MTTVPPGFGRPAGLLLAAGSGRRYGGPKALADNGDGPWVVRALRVMAALDPMVVVVGAWAKDVEALLPPSVLAVRNTRHHTGMGSSLVAGLAVLKSLAGIESALVMLVDLPGVTEQIVVRVAARSSPSTLARACYGGELGHPVLLGRDHFGAIIDSAVGDRGGRGYLATRDVELIECADLGSGQDVDTC